MNIQFVPNLFLEVLELERFKDSLDSEGFRKQLLKDSESFGLIKNNYLDPNFLNGRVTRDVDTGGGDKTIKINELFAVDKNGLFPYSKQQTQIIVPNDGDWHWVRVKHNYSTLEDGIFSIDTVGNLTLTSGSVDLTEIFRGQPNFPTRVKLTNSVGNTLEYSVLEVISATHAVLQHPSLSGGSAQFISETSLTLAIVGTFTPGITVPGGDKYPFKFDSITTTLHTEAILNQRPAYTVGSDFYLARVKVDGADVIVQDKRIEYWESKGSQKVLNIERGSNALVGVEQVKWDHPNTPGDRNIVELAWGMRSDNFTVDTSQNKVTFLGGSLGGKFKTSADFTNGDFNGWRLYTDNGKYSKIISSVKSGGSINLTLDVLDVDNYSTDGGTTFINQVPVAVPDADSIQFEFTPEPTDGIEQLNQYFEFPINTGLAQCRVVVYKDPSCLYTLKYRYKTLKEFTDFEKIPSDMASGYYEESSFNIVDGSILGSPTKKTYNSGTSSGFIELVMSPLSLAKFKSLVYKGDLLEVERRVWDYPGAVVYYQAKVGFNKQYQIFDYTTAGPFSPFSAHVLIDLPKTRQDGTPCVNGNRWVFWLRGNLDFVNPAHTVKFVTDFVNPTTFTPVYLVTDLDKSMINTGGGTQSSPYQGLRLEFVYDGTKWDLDHTNENYLASIGVLLAADVTLTNAIAAINAGWVDIPRADWGDFYIQAVKHANTAPPYTVTSVLLTNTDIVDFHCRKKVIGKTCHLEFKMKVDEINLFSALPTGNYFYGFIFEGLPANIEPKHGTLAFTSFHERKQGLSPPLYFSDLQLDSYFDTNSPTKKLIGQPAIQSPFNVYDNVGAAYTAWFWTGCHLATTSGLISFSITYELP